MTIVLFIRLHIYMHDNIVIFAEKKKKKTTHLKTKVRQSCPVIHRFDLIPIHKLLSRLQFHLIKI